MRALLAGLARDGAPGIDECVEKLGERLELLRDFKTTPQDPGWHAEGDVHIHTGMVLEELYKLLESRANHLQSLQNGQIRQALVLGALLHDIAKPLVTRKREVNGIERVVAPRHEARGRAYLAFRLMELELPYPVVRLVMDLVGEHHRPKLLVVRDSKPGDYLRLARQVEPEYIYWLELADMLGRESQDHARGVENIELFGEFAREYGVWNFAERYNKIADYFRNELADFPPDTRDLVFGNCLRNMESGLITTPEEELARSYTYRESFPRLVLFCGPGGAGKSSFAAECFPEYQLISLDNIRQEISGDRRIQKDNARVVRMARDRLKECLRRKESVVWDSTGLRHEFREMTLNDGQAYGALTTLVVFALPRQEFFRRNGLRKNATRLSDEVLHKHIDTIQWPTDLEAHRTIYVGPEGRILERRGFLENY